MDLPENMEVYLMDDEGNIVATAKTNKNGRFTFEDVAKSERFLFQLSQKDPNLELKIINNRGQLLGATSRDEKGNFVYLTNLQKSVKTPDVSGVFQYGKLPAADVQLNLMDENDELISHTRTNQKGEFAFEQLDAGTNYAIKVDKSAGKVPDNAQLFLKDKHTGRLLPVAKNGSSTFHFQTLAYDEPEELALITEEEDDTPPKKSSILQNINYEKLPMDLPEGMELLLVDEDGNVISRTFVDKNNRYRFEKLEMDEAELALLLEQDETLRIIAKDGTLLATLDQNASGQLIAKAQTNKKPAASSNATQQVSKPVQQTTLSGGDEEVIYYAFSDWKLSKEARQLIDQIILKLNASPNLKLIVNTHADARGEDDYNLWLSERRASIIQQYLNLEGIDLKRVVVYTFGEAQLANACGNNVNCTSAQHAKNRRAVFKFVRK
jgi:outer membrane protein OmpA-like peptidoglycan-associated protein